jgi:hypothetical protein
MNTLDNGQGRESDLGPLAHLIGAWEGIYGEENEPGTAISYHETITFEPIGPVDTGAGKLYGLRSSTFAWAYGRQDDPPIHEELGYWFWCPRERRIIRSFTNHNGVAINAAGQCDADADHFEIDARADADTYGIVSTPLLNHACRTLAYRLALTVESDHSFSYREETRLQTEGGEETFIHRDHNQLAKVY